MRYQVPQFIEVEDKIFGPLTFKQFIYLAGGAGLGYILYRVFPLYIAIFLIIPAVGFAAALAFYKVNNRPFVKMLESGFNYMIGRKLYLWKKEDKKIAPGEQKALAPTMFVPRLSESRLKDLTWSLDINETIYSKNSKRLEGRESF